MIRFVLSFSNELAQYLNKGESFDFLTSLFHQVFHQLHGHNGGSYNTGACVHAKYR